MLLGEKSLKKNEKIWDNVPIGGEVKKTQKCPNFHLVIWKTEGGGLYFSKMSQFPLFDSVVCNITFIRNV